MKLFERTKPATAGGPLIVEVEKPRVVPEWNKDVAASIATLQGHPGFAWLLGRLRLHRASMKSALCSQRQETLRDVEFLQSGIAWTGWLESQLTRALGYHETPPEEPGKTERELFEEQARFLQVLK